MPHRCSVPLCKGNYNNGPKVHVFSFPKEENLCSIWLRAIKRDSFTPTSHSKALPFVQKVCELHFRPEDIEWETSLFNEETGTRLTAKLKRPRLREGAIPMKIPNAPAYLSTDVTSRESPIARRKRKEEAAIQAAVAKDIGDKLEYQLQNNFTNLDELETKLGFLDSFWSVKRREGSLQIYSISEYPHTKIQSSLIIDTGCAVKAFINSVEVHSLVEYKIPAVINDIKSLEELLRHLKNTDLQEQATDPSRVIFLLQFAITVLSLLKNESYKFFSTVTMICEQLHLMTLKRPEYSPDFLIFSSLLYNCSPKGYNFLRSTNYMMLPCYSTVRRLTISQNLSPAVEQNARTFLLYVKNKFKYLSKSDITVTLMIDEIHIKPYYDYKGGSIVGSAYDRTEAATSAFVFMINSLFSGFKDVVHILPAKSMTAGNLFTFIKQIIIGLENIGFRVICVLTDNNAINQKAMSHFSLPPKPSVMYEHPADNSRPLFFMFDSVHLLKCIRNNWINQRDADKNMIFPEFPFDSTFHTAPKICNAPFATLHKLHNLEADSLLRYAYKLTSKALNPSSLERQNVSLALQIFNEYVIEALLTTGKEHCLPNSVDAANYIKVIYLWWTIMNVKHPHKGTRLHNKYATPLTYNVNDEKYIFLQKFHSWLDLWNNMTKTGGKLSRETFTALKHTTNAMIEITKYCVEKLKMKYVLPGKFQTDQLENRFGK
ncbi:uncharacterized protein LOC135225533 [Macrobrachium nipponense]|uniref:uncharacterized protein LOC135225533 n=1 Tax=Macrobrachium nipponense TaxID=159736 RepID=UPI0030C7E5C1